MERRRERDRVSINEAEKEYKEREPDKPSWENLRKGRRESDKMTESRYKGRV